MASERYQGKRFFGFLLGSFLVTLGFYAGPEAQFGLYAGAISGMYTIYLGGQSATDWKNGGSR